MKAKDKIKALLFLLAAVILSACTIQTNGIVLQAELREYELFRMNGEICNFPEAMIFIMDQKGIYEEQYTSEVWTINADGETYETYLLNELKSFLAQMKILKLMAEERDIRISSEESKKLLKASESYYAGLTEEQIARFQITQEHVTGAYEDYFLARKVRAELTGAAEIEISDNDAKVIVIEHILFLKNNTEEDGTVTSLEGEALEEKRALAAAVLEEARGGGTDFMLLASTYSNDSKIEPYPIARGEWEETLEQAAFGLEQNGISEIIETDTGFYIIKCVSDYEKEATQIHKAEMEKKHMMEDFYKEYEAFSAVISSEFNYNLWETINFADESMVVERGFFEIYNEIVEE